MSIYKNDKLIYVAQCVDSLLKQTFKDFMFMFNMMELLKVV